MTNDIIKEINDFINETNFDVRVSGNARWIDQKCTPDVLSIVADCVCEYLDIHGENILFTSKDIWKSKYTNDNILMVFRKPETSLRAAENEYDKFFQQPLKLLAYAGVLSEKRVGRTIYFGVRNMKFLSYIAIRERNALTFLQRYTEKVLRDSEIYELFENFFNSPTNETYDEVKSSFYNFTTLNTPINGLDECNRIFAKVINPLAFLNHTRGTNKGRISRDNITYDMLMYNRPNFRDIKSGKPKNITRKDYDSSTVFEYQKNEMLANYLSNKAKKELKRYNEIYNNGLPEVFDSSSPNELGTHIHHIFPFAKFPEISNFLENLIALHPTQHLNHAHINGNTRVIDLNYQRVCLLIKSDKIKEDYDTNRGFYDFHKFKEVLTIGLADDEFERVRYLDFNQLIILINNAYQARA